MDRQMVYPGQLLLETDLLNVGKYAYLGVAKLAAAILGTGTLVNGLSCSPTTPNSMSVVIGAGEIYALEATDQFAFSSLGTDSHNILKQGILADPVSFTFIAPTTPGESINYLIEAAFTEQDVNSVVLRYYNSANPSQAFSGPSGTGAAQNTTRTDTISVQVKDGTPAATGSQTTPAPDSAYVAMWVVTVAYGQTTITSGNISQIAGAPFITERLGDKISQTTADGRYVTASGLPAILASALAIYSTTAQMASAIAAAIAATPLPASFSGLLVNNDAGAPDTKIDVVAGSLVLSDGTHYLAAQNVSFAIDCTTVGANGLDSGALAANIWYSLFAISNGLATAGLASTSSTTPVMPGGYTYKRLVGMALTDGLGRFLVFVQQGTRWNYDSAQQISSWSSALTWAQQPCSDFIPPISTRALFQVLANYASSSSTISLKKNGSTSSTGHQMGYVTSGATSSCVNDWIDTDADQNVQLNCSAAVGSSYLRVLGFELNL